MKWLILICVPLTISVVVTHFVSEWTDLATSMKTLTICFLVLGGSEAIAYAIKVKLED